MLQTQINVASVTAIHQQQQQQQQHHYHHHQQHQHQQQQQKVMLHNALTRTVSHQPGTQPPLLT